MPTNAIFSLEWPCLHQACRNRVAARPYRGLGPFAQSIYYIDLSQLLRVSTMDANSKREKWQEGVLSSLNAAIEAMNLAKELAGGRPLATTRRLSESRHPSTGEVARLG